MNQMFDIALLILVGGSALASLLSAVALLLPRPVERTRDILAASLGRPFLIGLVNFLFVGAIAALLVRLAQGAHGALTAVLILPALLLVIGLAVFSLLGLAALTSLVGERISEGATAFRRHLCGSALVTLAGLTPYIGWFLFSPVIVLTGLGAGLQSLFHKKETAVAEKAS